MIVIVYHLDNLAGKCIRSSDENYGFFRDLNLEALASSRLGRVARTCRFAYLFDTLGSTAAILAAGQQASATRGVCGHSAHALTHALTLARTHTHARTHAQTRTHANQRAHARATPPPHTHTDTGIGRALLCLYPPPLLLHINTPAFIHTLPIFYLSLTTSTGNNPMCVNSIRIIGLLEYLIRKTMVLTWKKIKRFEDFGTET